MTTYWNGNILITPTPLTCLQSLTMFLSFCPRWSKKPKLRYISTYRIKKKSYSRKWDRTKKKRETLGKTESGLGGCKFDNAQLYLTRPSVPSPLTGIERPLPFPNHYSPPPPQGPPATSDHCGRITAFCIKKTAWTINICFYIIIN